MRNSELNIGQRILLECLWCGANLFARLPRWFKYRVVGNTLYFLLYYCLRYRMKVVRENLRNSFPEKSDAELLAIRRGFYHSLSTIIVDIVDMAHMTPAKVRRVVGVKNLEAHYQRVEGRDWIAMPAHFGCWEYCNYWGFFAPSQLIVAVYHPLHSPVMEQMFLRLRKHEYSRAVTMKESMRFYLRNREKGVEGRNLVMGLIADQNAPRRPDSHWFRFLNQDTIFFDGSEKLALRFNLPIYFVKTERQKSGRYEMLFVEIYDGQEQVEPNEITGRYVQHLEAMIRERPELWMWSHRRWKYKRPNAQG